ncbi:winged helix-turn-helix domain-containing protein [Streptomyces sp. NBC_01142]|uniref:AfsR/SARP family transcriptional regulator n=1 Tax=Streptomyces sp. NBC_01142 TaxID=2975865 RepID=UPI002258E813|nr:BTAD domain-containing putative transcriptional regulator [Streptomyces sp. NBC_01142]MCX4822350.1 winged helix-turn-helix domain-containing protein [Streptomyces sp. NBC_01142]
MEISTGAGSIHVAAGKQRTILAMLLTHAGHVVPVHQLVEEVWGDTPPHSAVPNLRTYVMQLRRLLRPLDDPSGARLVTSRSGYALRLAEGEFDIPHFEALAARGRNAAARQELTEAADAFGRALALWRGSPMEDIALGPTLRGLTASLTEQYLSTVENYADVELSLGKGAALVEQLRPLARRYPLRERIHSRLMIALYRSGDTAAALAAFGQARKALRDELGVDPGPELSHTHQAVLRRAPHLLPPSLPGEMNMLSSRTFSDPPRQLPRESTVFVGREREITRAHSALRSIGRNTTGAPVIVFHGSSGLGKSALALRTAHSVADRYPDGQLYVDLQGYRPRLEPLLPVDVLGSFLRALGMPRDSVPTTPAEAAAGYQSVLAGRRILIVADNVSHRSQVMPLLPASSDCAVLITSRSILPTLDAVRIAARALDATNSVRVLALLTGQSRVVAEPLGATEIARWCEGNPLALSIVGARFAGRPDWSLTGFAQRLRDPARRLDELQIADLSMRSCYAVSYADLSRGDDPARHAAADAFPRLSSLESPFPVARVTELLGSGPLSTERALDELVAVGLLEPVAQGLYRMRDLVRLYAAELAAAEVPPPRGASADLVLTRPAS